MKKSDYNIEFAHIYMNENFTVEHFKSAKLALEKILVLQRQGKMITSTVLIDDYNPTDKILDVKKFVNELDSLGIRPNYLVYESKMVNFKEQLLSEMNERYRRKYLRYMENHDRIPCSFLVAIWHLMRLGIIEIDHVMAIHKAQPFIAHKIITILPQRYGSIEKKALEIINSTQFKNSIKDSAEFIFF